MTSVSTTKIVAEKDAVDGLATLLRKKRGVGAYFPEAQIAILDFQHVDLHAGGQGMVEALMPARTNTCIIDTETGPTRRSTVISALVFTFSTTSQENDDIETAKQ